MSDLEQSSVLQNSYVILTSDHGELFERGEIGHASALMYAPVTHIPLLVRAPRQQQRMDYHSMTTNLDLLPTLLNITGQGIPDWLEGSLVSARLVLGHLFNFYQPNSVLDVGCGKGTWLKACQELGATDLVGLDGPWNKQENLIDPRIAFKAVDLNAHFSPDRRFDLAQISRIYFATDSYEDLRRADRH